MKKIFKIAIITMAAIVVAVSLLMLLYMMKFKKETGAMTSLETQKIIEGIYVLQNDYVNVYILDAGGQYVAFDAGAKTKVISAEMAKLNLNSDKVEHVFLTHTDTDHVSGIEAFSEVEVYLSEDEEQMINGSTKRMALFKNSLETDYTLLRPHEIKEIGHLEIACIPTPGHTPGSMSFLVNGRYLFVGDNMSIRSGKVGLFNDSFNMDAHAQAESLSKLAQLEGVQYIFSAHYGMTSDFESAMENWK